MKFIEANNIPIQKGSAATDWWNFITFMNIEDWLRVREALLDYAYWDMTLNDAMKRWSWWGYWAEILPWINPNVKISSLTENMKRELLMNQIKREDATMYKILKNSNKL